MEFANVGRRSPSTPDLHVKARSQANPSYPQRFKVDDEHVPWVVPWDEYEPTVYTDRVVLEQNCETRRGGWADPPVPPKRAVIETRGSHELQSKQLPWVFDDRGRPLNPRGRTGMSNRGVLGKWGPNHAGDAIVTRYRRRAPGEPTPPGASSIALEMVAIKRRDTGEWAIPGGMADPSEIGKAALMREFREEVGAVSADELARFDTLLHELFADSNGRVVYRGYVDDPRNVRSAQLPRSHSPPHSSLSLAAPPPTSLLTQTDHAWMETLAMHFHCSHRLGEMLPLHAGDDAAAVRWLEAGDHNPIYRNLYASHKQIVDRIVATHGSAAATDAALDADGRRRCCGGGGKCGDGGGGGASHDPWCGAFAHQLRLWAAAASGAPDAMPSDPYLSVTDVLDLFAMLPTELSIAKSVVTRMVEAVAHSTDGTEDVTESTRVLSAVLAAGDARVAGNIFENLHSLMPFERSIMLLGPLLRHVHENAHSWTFEDDVSAAAAPPSLAPHHLSARSLRVGQRALDALRLVAFVDKPPALVADSTAIATLRRTVFGRSRSAFWPTAVVMVGAPGSGKTAVLPQALDVLRRECGGPPADQYCCINPDFWITHLCHSNNEHRNLANYLNHETFLAAVAQRRHIVFDSTGKSLLNTCGRVIGRLRQVCLPLMSAADECC